MTKTANIDKRNMERGFSLIELMIAMSLGLILIGGVVNLFLASSQTYRLQESMFRVQESGRFALDFMLRDLRDAGFQNLLPENSSRNTNITAV
ncbi:PilW family protein, partial [Neptunomonas sp.]